MTFSKYRIINKQYRQELGCDTRITYAEHENKGVPFRKSDGPQHWIKREKKYK